jgi:hypothetical protein
VLWRRLRTDLGVLLRGARLLSRKGTAHESARS